MQGKKTTGRKTMEDEEEEDEDEDDEDEVYNNYSLSPASYGS